MQTPDNLKLSARAMYDELMRQNIPVRIADTESGMLEYTDNSGKNHLLFSAVSDKSSAAGLIIAKDKLRTERLARNMNIPVPEDILCGNITDADDFLKKHKRIVLKPLTCQSGQGVSTNITNELELRIGYDYALDQGSSVIAQQHIDGSDIRLLVIAGVFRSAVERKPAQVIGDGTSTIRELIAIVNASPERSDDNTTKINIINLESSSRYLQETIDSIPKADKIVAVVGPANLSLGGTAHETTDQVTDAMISDAENISKKLELAIAGVDMIWDRVTNKYMFIEINAMPAINFHNDSFWGTSTNAIEKYVDWLVQPNSSMSQT